MSEEISRVALNDMTFGARASLRVRASRSNPSAYTLDIAVDDDLSVRDGYLAFTVTGGIPGGAANLPIRVGDIIPVDPYNKPDPLTTDLQLSEDITLPFLALSESGTGGDPTEVENFQVYVRDQRAAHLDGNPDATPSTAEFYTMEESGANVSAQGGDGTGVVDGIDDNVTIAVAVSPATGTVDDGDDITLTATVTVDATDDDDTRQIDETDPPFKRVYFYAQSTNNAGQQSWRLIESLGRNAYDDGTADNTIVYEVEINAADYYAIVDDDGRGNHTTGMVIAIGVANDLPAMAEREASEGVTQDAAEPAVRGVVGLVSAPAAIPTIDP